MKPILNLGGSMIHTSRVSTILVCSGGCPADTRLHGVAQETIHPAAEWCTSDAHIDPHGQNGAGQYFTQQLD